MSVAQTLAETPRLTVDPAPFVRRRGGLAHLDAAIEGMSCVGCARKIERALATAPGVAAARVNLTNKRLALDFDPAAAEPGALLGRVVALGFKATPLGEAESAAEKAESRALLRALGVAGFAAGNVMIYSVAVWAGVDMGPATRSVMQWISALIALPAVVYGGMPFYRAAARALRHGQINMDVPISLALILTCVSSLIETLRAAPHVYFDGAATLTFILLIGRVLDHQARARARRAGEALAALQAVVACLIEADGAERAVPARSLIPGQIVKVRPGERVPADGAVLTGASDLDNALVTGESVPIATHPGDRIFAGTLNLTGPLTVRVDAAGPDTLLSEIARLMDNAAQGRARFVTFADKAIRIYAPAVHLLALGTFLGWLTLTDVVWQQALINAVTVLIITCPCALGLAVPVSHVVAAGRLFARGVLLKSGDALERLAAVDAVVFDKTGTLTLPAPSLVRGDAAPEALAIALGLAGESRHPLARALVAAHPGHARGSLTDVVEHPGQGIEGRVAGAIARLGSRAFAGPAHGSESDDGLAEIWFQREGEAPIRFAFSAPLRADVVTTLRHLVADGLSVEVLSGDRPRAVADVARLLDVPARGGMSPAAKLERLSALAAAGHHVLMVGDGLNDAPALAGAHVSMAPASAADISQTAADVVFQGDALSPVADTLRIARRTQTIVTQNISISLAYNLVAVPLAIMGGVTPLIAAVAMSVSSLTVVLNALRLKRA